LRAGSCAEEGRPTLFDTIIHNPSRELRLRRAFLFFRS
jgi:hypothetical protein